MTEFVIRTVHPHEQWEFTLRRKRWIYEHCRVRALLFLLGGLTKHSQTDGGRTVDSTRHGEATNSSRGGCYQRVSLEFHEMPSDRDASVALFKKCRATAMALWSEKWGLESPITTSLREWRTSFSQLSDLTIYSLAMLNSCKQYLGKTLRHRIERGVTDAETTHGPRPRSK